MNALRGALVTALAATATLGSYAAASLLGGAQPGGAGLLAAVAAAALVVGAVVGVAAGRVRGGVARRLAVLAIVALPALWTIVTAGIAALNPADPRRGPAGVVLAAALMAAVATGAVLPFATPGIAVSVLLVEGWTRPAALPATGFARRRPRRAALAVLAAVAVSFAAVVALRARDAPRAASADARARSPAAR